MTDSTDSSPQPPQPPQAPAAPRRSNGGGVRDEYKALTRRRLTDAAMAEFEERGYAACRIEDVARRAGVSRATFYIHFNGKVELVEGMWDLVRKSLTQLYRDLMRMEVRDEVAVRDWLAQTFDFYRTNRQRLIAIHEAIALESELAEVYMERIGEVSDMVAPLVAECRSVDLTSARFDAALLTMQHERFCFFWILRDMPFDEHLALQTMARNWHDHVGTAASV